LIVKAELKRQLHWELVIGPPDNEYVSLSGQVPGPITSTYGYLNYTKIEIYSSFWPNNKYGPITSTARKRDPSVFRTYFHYILKSRGKPSFSYKTHLMWPTYPQDWELNSFSNFYSKVSNSFFNRRDLEAFLLGLELFWKL